MSNKSKPYTNILVGLCILSLLALSFFFIKHDKINGLVVLEDTETDPSVVLKLSFNDPDNPWRDYSIYNHNFDPQGNIKLAGKSSCKWYNCADMTTIRGDFLNSTTQFKLDNGISVSFWIFPTKSIDGANSQYFFELGKQTGNNNLPNYKTGRDGGYGYEPQLRASDCIAAASGGESTRTKSNVWTHYFFQYDESRTYIWKNGLLIVNSSEPCGNLNYSLGENLTVGAGYLGIDAVGYMDEFMMYNRSNFTSEDVENIYDSQKLGTPPDIDVYIKNLRYKLPIEWNTKYHPLSVGGTMNVNFTIANAGVKDSGNFNYEFRLNGNVICTGRINIPANSEIEIKCPWSTAYGFHKGEVTLDNSEEVIEDNEINNAQKVYIPFLDKPWFHFNLDDFYNDYKPFCENPSNSVAYDSCNWMKSFSAMGDFNDKWTGFNVDPYGGNFRQAAMGCLYNDYNKNGPNEVCTIAKNHLFGWASRDLLSYSSVQSYHQLLHVGMGLDMMLPALSESEYDQLTKKYHDICQHISRDISTRPDMDDDSIIIGDNGKGFGSGIGGFCYTLIGSYSENPTLIQQLPDQYWGKNIPDEWMDRENSLLRSFKNDSWSQYQEGWGYATYTYPHLADVLYFRNRFNLLDVSEYQNALCSISREFLVSFLDSNYLGTTFRNDENFRFRAISRGDTNSYQKIDDSLFVGWDMPLMYASMCNDPNTKNSIMWLRESAKSVGDGTKTYPASYVWKELVNQGGNSKPPSSAIPKVIFDNNNDIFYLRSDYSYSTDTVIQIDGGEEKGSGHSQAQGYFLYALGEPFLDYQQVPYEDDVRAETWKNGISLQNDIQSIEGQLSFYSAACGAARLNQYYGMQDCPKPTYPQDYPDYRQFPLQYGGDLEDYVGTKDANFAGVYVWRPYKNANPVQEYFVKFGDLLAKRTVVSGNTENKGVYHNFINIYNEFSESRSGTDLTFTRNNNNLDINLIYSSQPMTLGGGLTNVNICFTKTSCSGGARGSSKYRRTYLYSAANNVDFILAHHWYITGQKQPITQITGNDKGLQQGNNIIIFDSDNDGKTVYSGKEATGWALAFNDQTKEIGAFNTTSVKIGAMQIFNSQSPISAHIKRDSGKIVLTVNTMERKNYIDFQKKVMVTIDAQELTNNNGFIVTKNGNENIQVVSESGTLVTFDVESGQNSDYYTIIGSGTDSTPPTIISAQNGTTTNQSAYILVATNENSNASISYGYSQGTFPSTAVSQSFQTSSSVYLPNLVANSTVYFSVTACDISRNCNTQSDLSFKTGETYTAPPDLTAPAIVQVYNYSTTNQSSFVRVQTNEVSNVSLQWGYSQGSLDNYIAKSSFSTISNLLIPGLVSNTSIVYSVTLCDLSQNCVTNGTFSFKTLPTTQAVPGIPPLANEFDGSTTDFSKISDLTNVTNVTIEYSSLGKISFPGQLNVSGLDLDSYINITNGSISLDSKALKNLNKTAVLSIYNLALTNPQILMDGATCPVSICTLISYGGGTLQFTVSHFTKYSTEETQVSSSSPGSSAQSASGGGGGGKSNTQAGNPKANSDTKTSKTSQKVLDEPGNIISEGETVDLTGSALEQKPDEQKVNMAIKVEAEKNKWELAALVLAVVLMTASIGFFFIRSMKQK